MDAPKVNHDSDKGKRLKREAVETSRRVDDCCARATSVSQLFSPAYTSLRLRLRHVCERLLLEHTAEHGSYAEETLWVKVYHDVYCRAKSLLQNTTVSVADDVTGSLLSRHLLAGVGSYQQLLHSAGLCALELSDAPQLQQLLEVDLCTPRRRWGLATSQDTAVCGGSVCLTPSSSTTVAAAAATATTAVATTAAGGAAGAAAAAVAASAVTTTAAAAAAATATATTTTAATATTATTAAPASLLSVGCVQRLLICLGDLTRYLAAVQPHTYSRSLAAAYYHQAALVLPSVGRPYNQLATLLVASGAAVDGSGGSGSGGSGSGGSGGAAETLLLPAVYHYMCAITCQQPLAAARHNLLQLLKNNHQLRAGLDMEYGNGRLAASSRLVVTFVDTVYGATLMTHAKQHRLVRLCQETLQWLVYCLQLSSHRQQQLRSEPSAAAAAAADGSAGDDRFDWRSLLLMATVTMMAIQLTSGEREKSAAILRALLLALVNCLLSDVIDTVTSHYPSVTSRLLNTVPVAGSVDTGHRHSSATVKQCERQRRGVTRRQRAAHKLCDELDSDDDLMFSDNDSVCDSLSSFDSDDDNNNNNCPQQQLNQDTLYVEDEESQEEDEEEEEEEQERAAEKMTTDSWPAASELVKLLADCGEVLATLHVCCVWLRANETILAQCVDSAPLWRQMAVVANIMAAVLHNNNNNNSSSSSSDTGINNNNNSNSIGKVDSGCGSDWCLHWSSPEGASRLAHVLPLCEDWTLRGWPLLASRHQQLDWRREHHHHQHYLQHHQHQHQQHQLLSKEHQVILRSRLILDFFTWISSHEQFGKIMTSSSVSPAPSADSGGGGAGGGRLVFVFLHRVPSDSDQQTDIKDASAARSSFAASNDTLPDKQQQQCGRAHQKSLMAGMAALWLQSEVRSLRRQASRGARPTRHRRARAGTRGGCSPLGTYLVPDTAALVEQLPLVRRLAASKQFVVVIPTVVVHELDERKSAFGAARHASRWLERQLRRGSRYVRSQRAHEKASLPTTLQYPRRSQRLHWRFFQMLECCRHLSASLTPMTSANPVSSAADTDSVTLLLGGSAETARQADEPVNVAGLAAAAGVHYEYIGQLYSKWRGTGAR